MTAKHTEGPWGRNIPPASKYPVIYAGRNTHVAQVLSKGLPDTEAEANANLITAAPELLAALKRMVAMHDLMMKQVNHGESFYQADCLCEMNEAPLDAAKALAKAEGENYDC